MWLVSYCIPLYLPSQLVQKVLMVAIEIVQLWCVLLLEDKNVLTVWPVQPNTNSKQKSGSFSTNALHIFMPLKSKDFPCEGFSQWAYFICRSALHAPIHVTGNQKCLEKVLKVCVVFKVLESWVIILEVLPKGFENCICTLTVIGIMLWYKAIVGKCLETSMLSPFPSWVLYPPVLKRAALVLS